MIKVKIIITKTNGTLKYKRFANFIRIIKKHANQHHMNEIENDLSFNYPHLYKIEPYNVMDEQLAFKHPELAKAHLKNEVLNSATEITAIFSDMESYYNYRERAVVIETYLQLRVAGFVFSKPIITEIPKRVAKELPY